MRTYGNFGICSGPAGRLHLREIRRIAARVFLFLRMPEVAPFPVTHFSGLFFKLALPGAIRLSPVWVPGANVHTGLSQCQPSKHNQNGQAGPPQGRKGRWRDGGVTVEHTSCETSWGTQSLQRGRHSCSSPPPLAAETSSTQNLPESQCLQIPKSVRPHISCPGMSRVAGWGQGGTRKHREEATAPRCMWSLAGAL